MSFPELRDCEIVLADVNPQHLGPVLAHFKGFSKLGGTLDWRDGSFDGVSYVITAFSQGGPGLMSL